MESYFIFRYYMEITGLVISGLVIIGFLIYTLYIWHKD